MTGSDRVTGSKVQTRLTWTNIGREKRYCYSVKRRRRHQLQRLSNSALPVGLDIDFVVTMTTNKGLTAEPYCRLGLTWKHSTLTIRRPDYAIAH